MVKEDVLNDKDDPMKTAFNDAVRAFWLLADKPGADRGLADLQKAGEAVADAGGNLAGKIGTDDEWDVVRRAVMAVGSRVMLAELKIAP